jgi:SAM-dependent methyltransferase
VTTGQRWDPVAYATSGAFVPALGEPVLALLAPRTGERILDLGCGDGTLTDKIRATGAEVLGVDADPAMVRAAVAKGIDAQLIDGEALPFEAEFDAVFTNAALHWMPRAEAVAAGVFRALRAGGRYVGELGGRGNIAAIRTALRAVLLRRGYQTPQHEPQWYPGPEEFRSLHERAGFIVERADLLYRPTSLPDGMASWLGTFRAGAFDQAGVLGAAREAVIAEVVELLRPVLDPDGNGWMADYVRLRFVARKPD